MNEINTLNLWYKATARTICAEYGCAHCHALYKMDKCPIDVDVDMDSVSEFVTGVTELLRQWDEDNPFEMDITDDELVNILKQASAVEE